MPNSHKTDPLLHSEVSTPAHYEKQAEMLTNKVRKRYKHFRKRFAKQRIDVFRLYDWDIPEIRAAVDWYDGHLVIAEYTRRQSTPDWLPMMGHAVAKALEVPLPNLHLKIRKAGKQEGLRYERIDHTNHQLKVRERDLQFYVNLNDFVDTGLFSDHRNTRQMVRELVQGKDFLNLYCYTGAFTCYAAVGGARTTLSVDRSQTAISWLKENLSLNQIPQTANTLVQADTLDFLKKARQREQRFDLAVVDPPSYSTRRDRNEAFDIARDHPTLLQAVIEVMNDKGLIFFSTNHQRFEPHLDHLPVSNFQEITTQTIPEDYRHKRKTIHRCWKISI